MKTYYYIPNIWHKDELNVDDAIEFQSNRDIHDANNERIYDEWEVKWLIQEMSADFMDNHDGWEIAQTWQNSGLTFAVWDDNKQFIGEYTVILEYEPNFIVYSKDE